jgi:hypothetical protein
MMAASLRMMACDAVPAWTGRVVAALLLALALGCVASGLPPQGAQAQGQNLERSVKAAFLYKFLGYVEYPGDMPAQMTVGVIGADDIATELTQITAGRMINGRPIVVKTLRDPDALAGLQLVFVGGDAAQTPQILRNAAKNGVLSVTETENGLQQGSVINFRLVDDRVRFEISLPAAEKNNVRLSSRLLSVAYQVQKGQ